MSQRESNLWKHLVDEVGEEEIERAASVSVQQAEAELTAAGFDVPAERAKASAFLDALAGGESVEEPKSPVVAVAEAPAPAAVRREPSRPRPAAVWLAVAAATVAGGALYAGLHPPSAPTAGPAQPPHTTPPPFQPTLPALVTAADLRRQAAAACDAARWSECLAHLDAARTADPDGDDAPTVKAMRERALREVREKPKP